MKEPKRYVGVVVKNDNKFLLCKRNTESSYPGMWSIPGGKLETLEETRDGALREFYEETNCELNEKQLKFIGLIPRKSRDGNKVKGWMYVYQVDSDDKIIPDLENAIDGEEHTECGYFTIDEVDENKCGEHLFKLLKTISQK